MPLGRSNRNGTSWASASAVKIAAGDFDGDGDGDLVAVGGPGWVSIGFALGNGSGGFSPATLPIAGVPSWGRSARVVLAGKVDTGATADLILTGYTGFTTMPVVFLKP